MDAVYRFWQRNSYLRNRLETESPSGFWSKKRMVFGGLSKLMGSPHMCSSGLGLVVGDVCVSALMMRQINRKRARSCGVW